MTESSDRRRGSRAKMIVIVGYVLWIVIAVTGCFAIYYLDKLQSSLRLKAEFPTPTATPEAHIKPGDISNANKIFEEHFVNSTNDWLAYQGSTQFSKQDDKLVLQSITTGRFGAVVCDECVRLDQPYYFQADLGTDAVTTNPYGILFNSGVFSQQLFYAFLINEKDQAYFLESFEGVDWALHTSGKTDFIKPYPNSNTLGIYVSSDYLEMYINGNRVDTYQETKTSFQNGTIGFYIDNSGPQLIVRNAFIYAVK
jgi:hypothetical protein